MGHSLAQWAAMEPAAQDPDVTLVVAWRGGDREAAEKLFARHFASVFRFFQHKVPAEADELTQRTFVACLGARDQFRAESSFRTYLFAIARREFLTFLRRKSRSDDIDFAVTSIAELATTLGTRMARAEEIGQLRTALLGLPVEQQMLLELHYWQDLDAGALGEIFGVPDGTIRVRLLRARRALRDRLAGRAVGAAEAGAEPDRLLASLREVDEVPIEASSIRE